MRWVSMLEANPRHIFITHGEKRAAEQFSNLLKEKTGCETSVPTYGTKVRLE
jgi:predicted metal-dependent RNase